MNDYNEIIYYIKIAKDNNLYKYKYMKKFKIKNIMDYL